MLVICTTDASACLKMILRGKGVAEEEELVFCWVEAVEFIGSCCLLAAIAVSGIVNVLTGINITVIANTVNILSTLDTNGFLIAITYVYGLIRVIHQFKIRHVHAHSAGVIENLSLDIGQEPAGSS